MGCFAHTGFVFIDNCAWLSIPACGTYSESEQKGFVSYLQLILLHEWKSPLFSRRSERDRSVHGWQAYDELTQKRGETYGYTAFVGK